MNHPLTRPPATLSPSDGEREGVRGPVHRQAPVQKDRERIRTMNGRARLRRALISKIEIRARRSLAPPGSGSVPDSNFTRLAGDSDSPAYPRDTEVLAGIPAGGRAPTWRCCGPRDRMRPRGFR